MLRPDRLTHALQAYCSRVMGPAYTSQVCLDATAVWPLHTNPPQDPFAMTDLLRQTSSTTPVLFVLFPGYSPTKDIEACATTQVLVLVATACATIHTHSVLLK